MKLEKKLEKIINEGIVVGINENEVLKNKVGEVVKFIDNGKCLIKLVEGNSSYLVLSKITEQIIEVLQIVQEDIAGDYDDTIYSFADEKTLIKLQWSSWGDIEAYDVRAYEYRLENDKIVLGEIRYTDLVEKPNMTDVLGIGLTLIDAIDNNYFPCSMLDECFKSLCIKWGEEIDWELYNEVRLSLEEDEQIEVENYLGIYLGI